MSDALNKTREATADVQPEDAVCCSFYIPTSYHLDKDKDKDKGKDCESQDI